MNIGERIRALRLEKKMTQSELAGVEITRNMLSRIENDAALPSVPTLLYLASRLGVPAGLLLADDGETRQYRKTQHLADIRRTYRAGEYRVCREICRAEFPKPDDEIALILTCCDAAIAREEFHAGNLRECSLALMETLTDAKKTNYPTGELTDSVPLMFRYLSRLSPSFSQPDETGVPPKVFGLSKEDRRMISFLSWLEQKDTGQTSGEEMPLLQTEKKFPEDPYTALKEAEALAGLGQNKEAAVRLRALLDGQTPLPRVLLLELYSAMEVCCRETGDYKGAYECVSARMETLTRLLREENPAEGGRS